MSHVVKHARDVSGGIVVVDMKKEERPAIPRLDAGCERAGGDDAYRSLIETDKPDEVLAVLNKVWGQAAGFKLGEQARAAAKEGRKFIGISFLHIRARKKLFWGEKKIERIKCFQGTVYGTIPRV